MRNDAMLRGFGRHEEWLQWLGDQLPEPKLNPDAPVVIDLFAGCGGLALGFEAAGFRTVGYEMRTIPVATYNANLSGPCYEKRLDIGEELGVADVVIGGPPCQPFSQIGYQRGRHDDRDGFPIFLDAVRRIRPRIAIIENVRGLLFRNKDYLRNVARELERFGYGVDCRLLDTSQFGVPQRRQRVVIVASLCGWTWPEPVVSKPVTAGIALGELASKWDDDSRFLTPSMDAYVADYERRSFCVRPRDLHLDRPARTLTCRNLSGATSDMQRIRLPDGRRRMLEVREAARLQSFPDWFQFYGTKSDALEQIGNAVAPLMGLALARSVKKALDGTAPRLRKSAPPIQVEMFVAEGHLEKVEQALAILRFVGVPLREMTRRRQERVAKALLAVAGLRPADPWPKAKSHVHDGFKPVTTRDILKFWNANYGESLADSSYDDVRREDLAHLLPFHLVQASAADPTADINDGTRGYALTEEAVILLRSYGTDEWEDRLARFRANISGLADRLSRAREMKLVPVILPGGKELKLSPGPHNLLQKAILEEFLPRFAPGARVLYLGDAKYKELHIDRDRLAAIGLPIPGRNILPDVIALDPKNEWVFFVEAVHSFGAITNDRRERLVEFASGCNRPIIFVTAFEDRRSFGKWAAKIGWETEVWIASNPMHMVHFDGRKFLGPYE
jgi:site-specific DNA-cytosine methylase